RPESNTVHTMIRKINSRIAFVSPLENTIVRRWFDCRVFVQRSCGVGVAKDSSGAGIYDTFSLDRFRRFEQIQRADHVYECTGHRIRFACRDLQTCQVYDSPGTGSFQRRPHGSYIRDVAVYKTNAPQVVGLDDCFQPARVFTAVENDGRIATLGQCFNNPRPDASLRAGDEIGLGHLLFQQSRLQRPLVTSNVDSADRSASVRACDRHGRATRTVALRSATKLLQPPPEFDKTHKRSLKRLVVDLSRQLLPTRSRLLPIPARTMRPTGRPANRCQTSSGWRQNIPTRHRCTV